RKTEFLHHPWSVLRDFGMMRSRISTPECEPTGGGSVVTFKEVMDQVITWLQQDQRISYRALKRQFALENDYLDDLKMELIEVKRVAVDHDGTILVWPGAAPVAEPGTRPQAEAERQFHTVLLAVMGLLQREQRVTYRSLRYIFGVDEACLHAVRDELCFR